MEVQRKLGLLSLMRRSWKAAREKVDREGECRVCGGGHDLQSAHVIGRVYDPPDGKVRPVDIVPLCANCHQKYDARSLDLLPCLSHDEQAAAVGHVGIVAAYQRTTGERLGRNH